MSVVYCTQKCPVLSQCFTVALYLYDILTVKKAAHIQSSEHQLRKEKSDCMEYFTWGGNSPHQLVGKTLFTVLSDSNRGSHILLG